MAGVKLGVNLVLANERAFANSIQKTINKITTGGAGTIKLNFNERDFTGPLGRITAATKDFDDALAASNKRVIAFGASAGIMYAVTDAFKKVAVATIEVEKAMVDINSVFNLTDKSISKVKSSMFEIAKTTGTSWDDVAEATKEFSRQGLGAEQTLQRVKDAMILVRLTGISATKAVDGLTTAMNAYQSANLSSSEILNKMVAVDRAYAISSAGLVEALSRVGSTASDAGVSIDELMGLVTAARQITGREASVIGNSLKTIFTRLERSSTLDQLQAMGIAVRDFNGNARPVLEVLKAIAESYKHLGRTQQRQVSELAAGVFQINQFTALLSDLSGETKIFEGATESSRNATDDAYRANEKYNASLATTINTLKVSATKAGEVIGSLSFKPAASNVIGMANSISDWIGNINPDQKETQSLGQKIGSGILSGLGNVLSGPGVIALFKVLLSVSGGFFKEILGDVVNRVASTGMQMSKSQAGIMSGINNILQKGTALEVERFKTTKDTTAQHQILLGIMEREAMVVAQQVELTKRFQAAGFGGQIRKYGSLANGYIPNAADGLGSAVFAETKAIAAGAGGASKSAKPILIPNFNFGYGVRGPVVANSDEYIVRGRSGGDAIYNNNMASTLGLPVGAKKIMNAADGLGDFQYGQLRTSAGHLLKKSEIEKLNVNMSELSMMVRDAEAYKRKVLEIQNTFSSALNASSKAMLQGKLEKGLNTRESVVENQDKLLAKQAEEKLKNEAKAAETIKKLKEKDEAEESRRLEAASKKRKADAEKSAKEIRRAELDIEKDRINEINRLRSQEDSLAKSLAGQAVKGYASDLRLKAKAEKDARTAAKLMEENRLDEQKALSSQEDAWSKTTYIETKKDLRADKIIKDRNERDAAAQARREQAQANRDKAKAEKELNNWIKQRNAERAEQEAKLAERKKIIHGEGFTDIMNPPDSWIDRTHFEDVAGRSIYGLTNKGLGKISGTNITNLSQRMEAGQQWREILTRDPKGIDHEQTDAMISLVRGEGLMDQARKIGSFGLFNAKRSDLAGNTGQVIANAVNAAAKAHLESGASEPMTYNMKEKLVIELNKQAEQMKKGFHQEELIQRQKKTLMTLDERMIKINERLTSGGVFFGKGEEGMERQYNRSLMKQAAIAVNLPAYASDKGLSTLLSGKSELRDRITAKAEEIKLEQSVTGFKKRTQKAMQDLAESVSLLDIESKIKAGGTLSKDEFSAVRSMKEGEIISRMFPGHTKDEVAAAGGMKHVNAELDASMANLESSAADEKALRLQKTRAERAQRWSNRAMTAGFAASMISGFIPEGTPGQNRGNLSAIYGLQGLGMGAMAGSLFGPWGAPVGAAVGGIGGAAIGFYKGGRMTQDDFANLSNKRTNESMEKISRREGYRALVSRLGDPQSLTYDTIDDISRQMDEYRDYLVGSSGNMKELSMTERELDQLSIAEKRANTRRENAGGLVQLLGLTGSDVKQKRIGGISKFASTIDLSKYNVGDLGKRLDLTDSTLKKKLTEAFTETYVSESGAGMGSSISQMGTARKQANLELEKIYNEIIPEDLRTEENTKLFKSEGSYDERLALLKMLANKLDENKLRKDVDANKVKRKIQSAQYSVGAIHGIKQESESLGSALELNTLATQGQMRSLEFKKNIGQITESEYTNQVKAVQDALNKSTEEIKGEKIFKELQASILGALAKNESAEPLMRAVESIRYSPDAFSKLESLLKNGPSGQDMSLTKDSHVKNTLGMAQTLYDPESATYKEIGSQIENYQPGKAKQYLSNLFGDSTNFGLDKSKTSEMSRIANEYRRGPSYAVNLAGGPRSTSAMELESIISKSKDEFRLLKESSNQTNTANEEQKKASDQRQANAISRVSMAQKLLLGQVSEIESINEEIDLLKKSEYNQAELDQLNNKKTNLSSDLAKYRNKIAPMMRAAEEAEMTRYKEDLRGSTELKNLERRYSNGDLSTRDYTNASAILELEQVKRNEERARSQGAYNLSQQFLQDDKKFGISGRLTEVDFSKYKDVSQFDALISQLYQENDKANGGTGNEDKHAEAQKNIDALKSKVDEYRKSILSAAQASEEAGLRIKDSMEKANASFSQGFIQQIKSGTKDWNDFGATGRTVANSLQSNLGNSFGDFVTGAKSGKDAFKDFVLSVLNDAARAMASQAMQGLLRGAFSGFFGAGAAGGGAVGGSIGAGFASGGTVSSMLTGGEFVFTPEQARRVGPQNLKAINNSYMQKFARGGMVRGGSGHRDDVAAQLPAGSYVIKKSAVQKYGANYLQALANGETQHRWLGGLIGFASSNPTITGAVIGGIGGALVNKKNRLAGALVGAGIGAAMGYGMGQMHQNSTILTAAKTSPGYFSSPAAQATVEAAKSANTYWGYGMLGMGLLGVGLAMRGMNPSTHGPRTEAEVEAYRQSMLAKQSSDYTSGIAGGKIPYLAIGPQGQSYISGYGYTPATRRFSTGGESTTLLATPSVAPVSPSAPAYSGGSTSRSSLSITMNDNRTTTKEEGDKRLSPEAMGAFSKMIETKYKELLANSMRNGGEFRQQSRYIANPY